MFKKILAAIKAELLQSETCHEKLTHFICVKFFLVKTFERYRHLNDYKVETEIGETKKNTATKRICDLCNIWNSTSNATLEGPGNH